MMKTCDFCGTNILFGGIDDGRLRFCSENCHDQGMPLRLAEEIPTETVDRFAHEFQESNCPCCRGPGPIDVQTGYFVWSIVLLTSYYSSPLVGCWKCGTMHKIKGILFSGVLGWWGFPMGLIMTPIQVGRNLIGLAYYPRRGQPSPQFRKTVKIMLATQLIERHQAESAGNPQEVTVRK